MSSRRVTWPPEVQDHVARGIQSTKAYTAINIDRPAACSAVSLSAAVKFGGKLGDVFGVSLDRSARFDLSSLEPLLDAAHKRRSGVVFEALDWSKCLDRYDGPKTLFYLDPPYFGGESDYGKDQFARSNFGDMAEQLSGMKRRFLLSINDTPEIRETFGGFSIDEVRLKDSVSSGPLVSASELLISDQPVPAGLL